MMCSVVDEGGGALVVEGALGLVEEGGDWGVAEKGDTLRKYSEERTSWILIDGSMDALRCEGIDE